MPSSVRVPKYCCHFRGCSIARVYQGLRWMEIDGLLKSWHGGGKDTGWCDEKNESLIDVANPLLNHTYFRQAGGLCVRAQPPRSPGKKNVETVFASLLVCTPAKWTRQRAERMHKLGACSCCKAAIHWYFIRTYPTYTYINGGKERERERDGQVMSSYGIIVNARILGGMLRRMRRISKQDCSPASMAPEGMWMLGSSATVREENLEPGQPWCQIHLEISRGNCLEPKDVWCLEWALKIVFALRIFLGAPF